MDIEEFIKGKKQDIDDIIRGYVPESFSREYMEKMIGNARYEYDLDAINNALAGPVWDFLSRGGKRWRPALFLLTAEALGADMEKVKDFSIVPELAHEGSIMVDDVEDSGELRRGKPCTHKIYGVDVAVNAGNLMYFLPMLVFMRNRDKFDKETILKAYDVFFQEMIKIHFGQGLDIWWHKGQNSNVSEKQYLQMCAFKTGCLARMAAKLASVLSNGTEEQTEKLGRFTETIGIAFQIQDDILSASSEAFQKGKGYGDDITEGKRTLMVIHTLKNASEEDGKRLMEILDMHTSDMSLIKEALSILEKYGSLAYARQFSRELVNNAWNEVDNVLPESSSKEKLKAFADFLIERKI